MSSQAIGSYGSIWSCESQTQAPMRRSARLAKFTPTPSQSWSSWLPSATKTMAVFMIAICLICPFLPAAAAACIAPQGSYRDTCKVTWGSSYQSECDEKLANIRFCEFDISCKKLNGQTEINQKLLPEEAVGCLSYYENCDGKLIARFNNERHCVSTNAIASELKKHRDEL